MPPLPPNLSGRRVQEALEKVGFSLAHERGTHMVLRREDPRVRIIVPVHRHLKPALLEHIVEASGLTADEFADLF